MEENKTSESETSYLQQTPAHEHRDWKTLPWYTLEQYVLHLQRHIYQASQRNDTLTVHHHTCSQPWVHMFAIISCGYIGQKTRP